VGTDECCAAQGENGGGTGSGGTVYEKCVSLSEGNLCGNNGDYEVVGIPCDDSGQCGSGELCCGTTDDTGAYSSIVCQTTCTGDGTYVFCDPNAVLDVCATLGGGYSCTASTVLPGYYRCANASVIGGSGSGSGGFGSSSGSGSGGIGVPPGGGSGG
jgi:hypothetical protein